MKVEALAPPPIAEPEPSIDIGPCLTIDELFTRIKDHDYSVQEWEILTIASELARIGRVRAIGRPCDLAEQPSDRWERTAAHVWADLVIHLRPRMRSHPGDAFWRSTGKRAYASVQFCCEDLEREWLTEILARPRLEAPADVTVPPIKRTTLTLAEKTKGSNRKPPPIRREDPVFPFIQDKAFNWLADNGVPDSTTTRRAYHRFYRDLVDRYRDKVAGSDPFSRGYLDRKADVAIKAFCGLMEPMEPLADQIDP